MNRAKYFLLMLVCQATLFCQAAFYDTVPAKKKLSIIHYAAGGKEKGYILSANDSTIYFIEKKYDKDQLFLQRKTIAAENIAGIVTKSRKNFTMLDGMAIGAGAGILIGFSIGLADCDDPENDCSFIDRLFYRDNIRTALSLSAVLGGVGALSGIFTGGKKKTRFTLNGNRDNLKKYKYTLLSY